MKINKSRLLTSFFVIALILSSIVSPVISMGVNSFDQNTSKQIKNLSDASDTDSSQSRDIVPNPELPSSCGIDMVLILDSSGSIDVTELALMKSAFIGFVGAFLPNTPTEIAVVEFDTIAHSILDYTADVPTIEGAINSAVSGGITNWEDALVKAFELFDNRPEKPDLYVFASDGNPNAIGETGQSVDESVAVAAAIAQANIIKQAGIRIITLGIGDNLNPQNLINISSVDAYYASDFETLADTLADLADDLCGGTITVRKFVNGEPAEGWEFTAEVTGGTANLPSGATDVNGYIVFNIELDSGVPLAYVNITETLQLGYQFVYATATNCSGDPVGTPGVNSILDIPVSSNCFIYSEFINIHRGPIHVDDTRPGGDGSTWPLAFKYLQDALAVAQPGDRIWVAEGIYHPDERNDWTPGGTGDRAVSFELIDKVKIYGGFAGYEVTLEDREGLFDQTILTGDLNEDDEIIWNPPNGCDFINYSENSYRVVSATNIDNVIFDGFNITGGNAEGTSSSDPNGKGAGISIFNSNLVINNCTIIYNNANVGYSIGSGIYSTTSYVTIRNCTIIRNKNEWDDGAIYFDQGDIEIIKSVISDNNGNGIYYVADQGILENLAISDSVISDNTENGITFLGSFCSRNLPGEGCPLNWMIITNSIVSNNRGTGIDVGWTCSGPLWGVDISNCLISGNGDEILSLVGGGIHFTYGSTIATISNSIITDNTAIGSGGGILFSADDNDLFKAEINNCIIANNTAHLGGGILSYNVNVTIKNSMIINNIARRIYLSPEGWRDGQGGGIYSFRGSWHRPSKVEITGCTITDNTAEGTSDDLDHGSQGGGIRAGGVDYADILVNINNSILWNNVARNGSEICLWNNVTASVDYSDVEGGEDEVGLVDLYPPEWWWYPFEPILDWGGNNIDDDPLFVDSDGVDNNPNTWEDNDCHLSYESPCIDTGDPSYVPELGETDIDGDPRVVDGDGDDEPLGSGVFDTIDMGADELHPRIESYYSNLTHGPVGAFRLRLNEKKVEPRFPGVRRLEFEMNVPMDPSSVIPSNVLVYSSNDIIYDGTISTSLEVGLNGDDTLVVVEFDPALTDQECWMVDLTGMKSSSNIDLTNQINHVHTLAGDVSRNGEVTTGDKALIKPEIGEPLTEMNFYFDVNCDGDISVGDKSLIKPKIGNTVPECPNCCP